MEIRKVEVKVLNSNSQSSSWVRIGNVVKVIDFDSGNLESAIERRTLKDSTEGLIRSLLMRGEMKVGEIYSANSLAKELNVSNSPVREAMMSLVDRGLLEIVRNRGFRVVELTAEDVQEIYELRRLIEVEAVRVVAGKRLSPDQVDKLRMLAQRTDELHDAATSDDMFDYLEADQEFHLYLVSLTGNRRWVDLVERLRDQSRANGLYLHLIENGGVFKSSVEHLRLVDAVVSRDVQSAKELMIKHLDYARET